VGRILQINIIDCGFRGVIHTFYSLFKKSSRHKNQKNYFLFYDICKRFLKTNRYLNLHDKHVDYLYIQCHLTKAKIIKIFPWIVNSA
jgi:hypothetical protein